VIATRADVIRTTILPQQGRGHLHSLCRRSVHCCISRTGFGFAVMPAVTALLSRLCRS